MSRTSYAVAALCGALALGLVGEACDQEPAKQPTAAPPRPPPPPPAPPAPPKPKMVANPDGLSLAERMARREAEEKKVAAELAAAERQRLLDYDKTKLPLHVQVFASIKKTRGQYDALEKKIAGAGDKAKAKEDVGKLAGSLRAPIEAAGKKMATIDPQGGNSNVTTDYDVMLNALANDYPQALAASIDGDAKPLAEQKAELDKRTKKIDEWLVEAKTAKTAKATKKAKK
jgi:hypothetical protein